MRNTIAAAAAALLATTVAGAAADMSMPLKAPPIPYFTWDGFYLGVNAGYGWGDNQWTSQGIIELPGATTSNFNPSTNHVLGGVQAGANYQFGTWVAGIEADVMAFGARETANGNIFVGGGWCLESPLRQPQMSIGSPCSRDDWDGLGTARCCT